MIIWTSQPTHRWNPPRIIEKSIGQKGIEKEKAIVCMSQPAHRWDAPTIINVKGIQKGKGHYFDVPAAGPPLGSSQYH